MLVTFFYLLDVALNVEWQVEEKLETLQDVESVARGVGFVFPAQDLLEKSICGITCSYEGEGERERQEKMRALNTTKTNVDTTIPF